MTSDPDGLVAIDVTQSKWAKNSRYVQSQIIFQYNIIRFVFEKKSFENDKNALNYLNYGNNN